MNRSLAAAFSLIEVLIAVLILALGLLGLGALFPVVIREQRIGTEMTMGILAADAARAELEALRLPSGFMAAWRDAPFAPPPAGQIGGIPRRTTSTSTLPPGAWYIPPIDAADGTLTLGHGNAGATPLPPSIHKVKLYDRLYPKDVLKLQPQFVWDLAVQRVPGTDDASGLPAPPPAAIDPTSDTLRFVIFVRRIDPRIRVPVANLPGAVGGRLITLLDTLTNRNLPAAQWRVPVAIDSVTGLPTQDGLGAPAGPNYAPPMVVGVRFQYDPTSGNPDDRRRDRLYARNNAVQGTPAWELAKQVNQRLVDNLGNQYTVIESGVDASGQFVRISPEIPPYVTREMAVPTAPADTDAIRQVVFTPQVPAGVVIWTVKP